MKKGKSSLLFFATWYQSANALELDGMENGIIYKYLGSSLISPATISSYRLYKPCDIILYSEQAKKLLENHEKICNTKIIQAFETSDLIQTFTDDFILLDRNMTITEARSKCKSFGSNLVSIRSEAVAKNLFAFMAKHNIKRTFSDIIIDRQNLEPVFQSDGVVMSC